MFISGHVTLRNDSCNLCRNKTARQVARKAAEYNCALKHVLPRVIIAGQPMISRILLRKLAAVFLDLGWKI